MSILFARYLALGICLSLLSACSKTIQWEEEVPLNTGEVIWVKRSVTYSLKGGAGNPFDFDYRPDWMDTLSFTWRGNDYSYTGDAVLMLLAISPLKNTPVLVADASMNSWDRKNSYKCTVPYYVQFSPMDDKTVWVWPPNIESWLYGNKNNLMLHRPKLEQTKKRYNSEDIILLNSGNNSRLKRVETDFQFTSCKN